MKLVRIPAGSFAMGSSATGPGASKTTIATTFYMGATEVTQAQWKAVMRTEPWKPLTPEPPTHRHAESNFLSVNPSPPAHRRTVTRNQISYQ